MDAREKKRTFNEEELKEISGGVFLGSLADREGLHYCDYPGCTFAHEDPKIVIAHKEVHKSFIR